MVSIGPIDRIGVTPPPQIGEKTGGGNNYIPTPIPQDNFFVTPTPIQEVGAASFQGANHRTALQEVSEVGQIGASKRASFENGVGGTNDPVDANGKKPSFCCVI